MKNLSLILTKSLLISSFIIFFTNCSMGQKGNGDVVKEKRNVSNFNALVIGGSFEVYLRQGDKQDVTIIADENIIEYVVTEVSGDHLKIKLSKSVNNYTELKAYITVTNLESIDISGACNLTGKNTIKTEELQIELSGASDVKLDINVSHLEIEASGASDLKIGGTAATADIDVSGASSVKGLDLNCKVAQIESSGASDVKLSVSQELSADASGASSITYSGSPKVDAKESTAADIKKL